MCSKPMRHLGDDVDGCLSIDNLEMCVRKVSDLNCLKETFSTNIMKMT